MEKPTDPLAIPHVTDAIRVKLEVLKRQGWVVDQTLELHPIDENAASTIDGVFALATRLHAVNIDIHNPPTPEEWEALGVVLLRNKPDNYPSEQEHINGALLCKNSAADQEKYLGQKRDFMKMVESFLNSPVYQRERDSRKILG